MMQWTPTFVDGLWHVTSLLTESEYSVETDPKELQMELWRHKGRIALRIQRLTWFMEPLNRTVPKVFRHLSDSNVYVLLDSVENDQTYVVSDAN